ncbi:hypothetical protein KI387_036605 [Taxus chinensis]|uniref:Uncharacterized protein n=1 Tax=Taxus chinensis TaxID=29808 RepID=A0AA38FR10_TAXCH|nr:hypothetical protein KI387_036605 [Taxus chinensis]
MLSWDFESHIDEVEFEFNVGALLDTSSSKEVNPIVNSQQLDYENACNALNKVSMEIEVRLFRRNNKIKSLEKEIEENN